MDNFDGSVAGSRNAILANMGFIDFETACQVLDVGPRTLERRIGEGLPVTRMGGKRLFRIEALRDWLISQERNRRAPPKIGRPAKQYAA